MSGVVPAAAAVFAIGSSPKNVWLLKGSLWGIEPIAILAAFIWAAVAAVAISAPIQMFVLQTRFI